MVSVGNVLYERKRVDILIFEKVSADDWVIKTSHVAHVSHG